MAALLLGHKWGISSLVAPCSVRTRLWLSGRDFGNELLTRDRRSLLTRCLPAIYLLAVAPLVTGCASAPTRIQLPEGRGVAFPGHEAALATAIDQCRRVRTIELMVALRGRMGDTRLRGRVRTALARPASLRLEGVSPFGAPQFILVARPDSATLILPRDRQVVTDTPADQLLEALAGVSLGPDDFRAVLTGCVVPEPRAVGGRAYGDEWIAVDLEGGATVYLKDIDGSPAVVAGTRGRLTVEYADHIRGLPRRVRVQANGTGTDLTAALSQVSINVELDPDAFVARVGDGYMPITLDQWRGVSPLEDPASSSVPTDR